MTRKPRDHQSFSNEEKNRLSQLNESRTSSYSRIYDAVCKVLMTEEKELHIPVADAATLILEIVMSISKGRRLGTNHEGVTTEKLVDLILHGIV